MALHSMHLSLQDLPLAHVITVFDRLGFTLGGPGEDWDVMWSYKYPFKSLPRDTLRNLKPHHKINHFPGSGCFTYKPQLATLHFPFIPKAFRLPSEFKELQIEVCVLFCSPDFLLSCSPRDFPPPQKRSLGTRLVFTLLSL